MALENELGSRAAKVDHNARVGSGRQAELGWRQWPRQHGLGFRRGRRRTGTRLKGVTVETGRPTDVPRSNQETSVLITTCDKRLR